MDWKSSPNKNQWVPVTSAEQIVVNVGDMLQQLTNDKLKSTTHRVVNPPGEMGKPAVFHPVLPPSGQQHEPGVPARLYRRHPPSVSGCHGGEYLDERLREIGLKMRMPIRERY